MDQPPLVDLGTEDRDGDGLSAQEEFLQMTVDSSPDFDQDGVTDSKDPCPNCAVVHYVGRVETKIVEGIIRSKDLPLDLGGPTYVVVPRGSFNLETEGAKLVAAEPWMLRHIERHYLDTGEAGAMNWVRLEDVILLPGAFYVYRVSYYCGKRCGGALVAFASDIPFHGPVFVASIRVEID